MADGRYQKRSTTWAESPSEKRLRGIQNAIELRREIDSEQGKTITGLRLSPAEQAAIREACKPRVRR